MRKLAALLIVLAAACGTRQTGPQQPTTNGLGPVCGISTSPGIGPCHL